MRILLVGLNARYVHTNLAIRYLKAALKEEGRDDWNVCTREFSINEQLDTVASEIYEEKPDAIGFSCYIWNINQVIALTKHLKLVLPDAFIFVGGPEVSFDAEDLLNHHPQLDAAIIGEGECSVSELIKAWSTRGLPWDVKGVVWRWRKKAMPNGFSGKLEPDDHDLIVTNENNITPQNLNHLPNPYAELEDLQGRLAYVETSRGCPYNCKFCISSISRGVRFLDPEKFRLILRKLFQYGATTVKFVDRTFNANKRHAFMILQVFREEAQMHGSNTTLRAHCEMAGELIDAEWLDFLRDYPAGMIQLEIGVQSTHQPTLDAINRSGNFSSWKDKVYFLQHTCNIPVHLDLIAGLPHEGWTEFSRSFNEVYQIRPDNLQLGFLKVLKGSEIWNRSEELGLVYSKDPPYSILKTKELSYDQMLALKRIEEILEKYYNSGRFTHILQYVLERWESPFAFYHSYAQYWKQQGWFSRQWSQRDLFRNLWEYLHLPSEMLQGIRTCNLVDEQRSMWNEALKFDYYLNERPGQLPEYLQNHSESEKIISLNKVQEAVEIVRRDPIWKDIVPEYNLMDRRQWARATAVERFAYDVPEYLYNNRNWGQRKHEIWYLFCYTGKKVQYFRYDGIHICNLTGDKLE